MSDEAEALRVQLDEWVEWRKKYQGMLDESRRERDELVDALEDVVNQACSTTQFRDSFGDSAGTDNWELDSMALSAYAHGLETLAKFGRVKIEQQAGRRVIASWVKHDD